MELTPEERRHIYEEEKARIEAEEAAAKQAAQRPTALPIVEAAPKNRFGDPETPTAPAPARRELKQRDLLTVAFCAAVCWGLYTFYQTSPSPSEPVAQAPASQAPVKPTPTPGDYEMALEQAGQGEFLAAIGLLEQVPKKDPHYKLVKAKIKEYKAKAKVKEKADAIAEAHQRKEADAADKQANPAHWVQVQKNWTWNSDGYGYDNLEGSIKNDSARTVQYWKVTVDFKDAQGNIIDSAYTNELEPLYPGAAKRWHVMHSSVPGAKSAYAAVSEVRF